MPTRIRTKLPTFFDVDDTLVFQVYGEPKEGDIYHNGVWWRPHNRHINQLKGHASRGHTIVVWSAGGEEWAYKVCKLLGLLCIVDYTIEKPRWCYDDKNDWINWVYYDMEDTGY